MLVGLGLVLRDVLAAQGVADRACRAGEIVHKVFEASLKAAPVRLALACRKGCSYCCYSWVSATAPELFLVARTIGGRSSSAILSREAVLARAAALEGIGIADRFGRKLACPLLVGDSCGAYGVRPTVCRQVTSTDLAACIDEFEGRDAGGDVTVAKIALDHARNCRLPLQAALLSLGLPAASYELSAGLRVSMERGSETAWLAGSDPFEGIARAPDEPPQLVAAIRTIATDIAGL